MQMLSFEVDNRIVQRLNHISEITGLSRSELLREGVNEIIKHYSIDEKDIDGEPSVRDLLKRVMNILEQTRN